MNHHAYSPVLDFRITAHPQPVDASLRAAILADPQFGARFTDHMVCVDWSLPDGWHDARVEPFGPLPLLPGAAALQYAQEVFEGLKCYRHPDDTLWLFRPDRNIERLQRSAERLALPAPPAALVHDCLRQLISADAAWVPRGEGEKSLYLRPFLIGTEQFLGMRPSREARLVVIASPAGRLYDDPQAPVDVWLSQTYIRAALGGTGEAKCGSNYASSLKAGEEAAAHGCSQTLFLDAETSSYVDELGGMNLMLVTADGQLITPELSGSILHGVTRESLLRLAEEELGLTVREQRLEFASWRRGVTDGTITEVLACGTAAIVQPIGRVHATDYTVPAANQTGGPVTRALRSALTDLQYGRCPDTRGWLVPAT